MLKYILMLTSVTLCCLANGQNSPQEPYQGKYIPNLAEILQRHGFTGFYRLLRQAGLYSILYEKDAYTVFTPVNSIINDNYPSIKEDVKSYIEYHIIKGKYTINKLRDGMHLNTYQGNTAIVNKLYDRSSQKYQLWIQGFPVSHIQNTNTGNCVLFRLDSYLSRPSQDVYNYLRTSGQHNLFFKIFDQQNIYFQFPFGTTLIAPFDSAFNKLPELYKTKIFSSDLGTRNFIRNHIITVPLCRDRLFSSTGWTHVINSAGRSVSLYQDSFNREATYINAGSVLTSNVLTNGFVYGITEAILPDVGQNLMEKLNFLRCQTFAQHLISSGIASTLTNLLHTYTVFAPSDQAFKELPEDVQERLKINVPFLTSVMKYHLALGSYISQYFNSMRKIKSSLYDQSKKTYLNLNSYQRKEISTIQNSIITKLDNLAVNGIIHIVDTVMIPPKTTLLEKINETEKLEAFKTFLFNWNEESILQNLDNPNGVYWSLLAPSNKALKRFRENNPNQNLKDLIFRHILPAPLFSRQIIAGKSLMVDTLAFTNNTIFQLQFHRPSEVTKRLRLETFDAEIITEDLICSNGVIHIVNEVFF